ncbi:MAG: hypothetical protein AB7T63_11860 [Planctomycetota bacterium]
MKAAGTRILAALACLAIAVALAWWSRGAPPAPADMDAVLPDAAESEDESLSGRKPALVGSTPRRVAAPPPGTEVGRGPAIAIEVVTAAGGAVARTEVRLTWAEPIPPSERVPEDWPERFFEHVITTDESGRAACAYVAPDATDVRVWVQTARWVSRIQTVDMSRAQQEGLRIVAVPACTVVGRAQLRDGTPAARREVLVRQADSSWPLPESIAHRHVMPFDDVLALTGADGSFRVTGLPPDALGLGVGSPIADGSGDIVWLPAREPGSTIDDVVLVAPDALFLAVQLRASDGRFLSGESVGVRTPGTEGATFVTTGRTDAAGCVRLGVDTVGPWELVHLLPDGDSVLRHAVEAGGEPVQITATATPWLSVEVVVQHHDGRPASGIKVGLVSHVVANEKADALASWKMTREEGRATLHARGPASDEVSLLLGAVKPGLACRWTLATATLTSKPEPTATLRTLPSVALSGRTVAADGSPAPGASLSSSHAYGTWVHPRRHEINAPPVISDAEGRYELTDLPPVGNMIYTSDPHRSWQTRPTWVSAQAPGSRLEGRELVVRDFVPLACKIVGGDTKLAWKARVAAVPAGETTLANAVYGQPDNQGRVMLAAPTAGPYDIVRVTPRGWTVLKQGVHGPARELELVLGDVSSPDSFVPLRVRVEPPAGRSAEGRHVRVSMASDGVRGAGLEVFGTTDHEGLATIEVPFLPPWGVSVSHAPMGQMVMNGAWRSRVSDLPGDAVLRVKMGAHDRVTGRIFHADGRGVSGARVQSVFLEPDPEAWVTTNEEGEYRLGYSDTDTSIDASQGLQIELPGVARRVLTLDQHEGSEPWWVLRLPPMGTLQGRLRAPEGVVLPAGQALRITWTRKEDEAWLTHVVLAEVDAGGAFSVADLPADRDLDVEVLPAYVQEARAHSVERFMQARAGGAPTTIEMAAVQPIAGRVVGRPDVDVTWHAVLRPATGTAAPVRAQVTDRGTFEAWPLASGDHIVELVAEREGIHLVVDRARAEPGNRGVMLQATELVDTTLVFEEAYGPAFLTVSDPVTHAVSCAQETPGDVEGQLVLALPIGSQLDVTVQFLEAQSYVARRLQAGAEIEPAPIPSHPCMLQLVRHGRPEPDAIPLFAVSERGVWWLQGNFAGNYWSTVPSGTYDVMTLDAEGALQLVEPRVEASSHDVVVSWPR